ncbi:MAG: Uma2 family endonuclease [Acetobacteraceae bacterium]|nr:Uma2 family endonuclease [Acetobacteraceae bacterium]
MSQALSDRLTEAQFFAWLERQETRHELVDGQPQAMVGTTRRHDRITANIIAALHGRLRGGRCVVNTADTAIRIPGGNIRYPDVSVDCGRFIDEDRAADAPVLVVEVLSRSTSPFDQTHKLEEYKRVAAMRHVLIVDPHRPRVLVHTRDSDGPWSSDDPEGLDAMVALPALGVELPLAEIYHGLEFRPVPRLVPTPKEDGLG